MSWNREIFTGDESFSTATVQGFPEVLALEIIIHVYVLRLSDDKQHPGFHVAYIVPIYNCHYASQSRPLMGLISQSIFVASDLSQLRERY